MAHALRHTPGTETQPKHEHHLHLVQAVGDELHHLREIEEQGDSPATPLIVVGHVLLALTVIVSVELAVVFAFYFGWL
jgi:hypothetical protein